MCGGKSYAVQYLRLISRVLIYRRKHALQQGIPLSSVSSSVSHRGCPRSCSPEDRSVGRAAAPSCARAAASDSVCASIGNDVVLSVAELPLKDTDDLQIDGGGMEHPSSSKGSAVTTTATMRGVRRGSPNERALPAERSDRCPEPDASVDKRLLERPPTGPRDAVTACRRGGLRCFARWMVAAGSGARLSRRTSC